MLPKISREYVKTEEFEDLRMQVVVHEAVLKDIRSKL
jgi:hypothetical protein